MTLGEQHILKDAIEMAGLEDRSLLMPCCHKGRNTCQNSEWNEMEKSESASENDANRSSPVPETSEKERQREQTDNDSDERQSEGDSVSATSVNDEILRGKPSISNVQKLNPVGTYCKIICE